jgi:AcrR family transcriptional regulator
MVGRALDEKTGSAKAGARRYRSPLRAQRAEETRAAVLTAAAEQFAANGWAATGIRDIAARAGVATETIYTHFSSKRALFQAVVDVAVVGDEEPVAVAERPEFAALAAGSRAARIAAAAAFITAIHSRTAVFAGVIREAAAGDEQIAEVLEATRSRQRQDVGAGMTLILGRSPTIVELDEVWALTSPELYLLLVGVTAWSPEHYERWMATTLARVVPRV